MTTPTQDEFMAQIKADMESPDADNWDALHPDLQPYVVTGRVGKMIRSPLIVDISPIIPWVNRRYALKLAEYRAKIDAGDWRGALSWIERPFRLFTLAEWRQYAQITHAQFRELLPWVWSDAEPDDTDRTWLRMWQAAVTGGPNVGGRVGDPLPTTVGDPLRVYRGQHGVNDKRGIAWSLDPDIAKMFAVRFNPNEFGAILRGTVARKDVLAYVHDSGRGENEVVCDPRRVHVTSYVLVPVIGGPGGSDVGTAVWSDINSARRKR
jgi:hypothetical protein